MTTTRANVAEEEYFRREEAERRREEAWDNLQRTTRENQVERDRIKAALVKRCPKCHVVLETRTLRGVEIDHCNSCEGIWLDAGKLEQLRQKPPNLASRLLATLQGNVAK